MSQDLSTHAKESISKLECLYEASELGSKERALAKNKSVWVPLSRSCVSNYVMMLVLSSCVGFKTFENIIPSRIDFAVPITFDGEHQR